MQCEYEAQAQIVQNYWRIIRNNVQRIMREGDKSKTSSNLITKDNIKLQDIKEKRDFAFTMGITAYVI